MARRGRLMASQVRACFPARHSEPSLQSEDLRTIARSSCDESVLLRCGSPVFAILRFDREPQTDNCELSSSARLGLHVGSHIAQRAFHGVHFRLEASQIAAAVGQDSAEP